MYACSLQPVCERDGYTRLTVHPADHCIHLCNLCNNWQPPLCTWLKLVLTQSWPTHRSVEPLTKPSGV